MKKCLIVSLGLVVSLAGWSQRKVDDKAARAERKEEKRQQVNQMLKLEEEGQPSFSKHSIFGFKVNHDGFGASYEMGKAKTPYKSTIFQFELNDKKHPKEANLSNQFDVGSGFIAVGTPFVYGKINHFYQAKGAVGQQVMIGNKGNKSGVAVSAVYAGGLSLGLLRPYYIDVQGSSGQIETIKYSSKDSADFLDPNYILGGTGLSTGWSEIKVVPGAHAKAALRFDWGRFNNSVTALEFGFNFEFYTSRVQQMATLEGKNFFVNGYLSLLFGKRK